MIILNVVIGIGTWLDCFISPLSCKKLGWHRLPAAKVARTLSRASWSSSGPQSPPGKTLRGPSCTAPLAERKNDPSKIRFWSGEIFDFADSPPPFKNLTTWPVEANKLAFSASSRGAMLADAFLAFAFTALPFPWPLAFGSAAFFFGLISELIQNLLIIRRRTLWRWNLIFAGHYFVSSGTARVK